ncbi:MAG: hypothetical protein ACKVT1_08515 [Dehalococcoidia bacterium]
MSFSLGFALAEMLVASVLVAFGELATAGVAVTLALWLLQHDVRRRRR